MSYSDVERYLKQLMYLKGEYIAEQGILVIKRAIFTKIITKSSILEKFNLVKFELMINKEFGNNKRSFTL